MKYSNEPSSSPMLGVMSYYSPPALHIKELIMQPPPTLNGGQGSLEFTVFEGEHTSQKVIIYYHLNHFNTNAFINLTPQGFWGTTYEVKRTSKCICMRLDRCTPLVGDVKVEVYNNKPKKMINGKEKLFHFWINTFFVKKDASLVREEGIDNIGTFHI